MSERAHPDDPGFKSRWIFRLRRGFLPWFFRNRYRSEFFWRYQWVANGCGGKDVLDIPCGIGWGTSLITTARSLVGVDVCSNSVAEAKQRYGHLATFREGNMENLDFPNRHFDAVCCLEGIEHVGAEIGQSFIAEAARVLRAEGTLFISSPHTTTGTHSGNPYHVKEYSKSELKELVSPYFKVESLVKRRLGEIEIVYVQAKRHG